MIALIFDEMHHLFFQSFSSSWRKCDVLNMLNVCMIFFSLSKNNNLWNKMIENELNQSINKKFTHILASSPVWHRIFSLLSKKKLVSKWNKILKINHIRWTNYNWEEKKGSCEILRIHCFFFERKIFIKKICVLKRWKKNQNAARKFNLMRHYLQMKKKFWGGSFSILS